jgi:hypothetical protein
MKVHNLTTLVASAAFALMMMFGSANRAVAHGGWGWGWGGFVVGVAAGVILSEAYLHRHRHYYYHHRRHHHRYYRY